MRFRLSLKQTPLLQTDVVQVYPIWTRLCSSCTKHVFGKTVGTKEKVTNLFLEDRKKKKNLASKRWTNIVLEVIWFHATVERVKKETTLWYCTGNSTHCNIILTWIIYDQAIERIYAGRQKLQQHQHRPRQQHGSHHPHLSSFVDDSGQRVTEKQAYGAFCELRYILHDTIFQVILSPKYSVHIRSHETCH